MTIDIGDPHWRGLAAYEDARDRRDFKRLVERLRGDEELGRHERDFLADYLEGKVPPRKNERPPDPNLPNRIDRVKAALEWLIDVDGWKPDAAKLRCTELFGVSESTVENYRNKPYQGTLYPLARSAASGALTGDEIAILRRLTLGDRLAQR